MAITAAGIFLLVIFPLFGQNALPIVTGFFTETNKFPLDYISIGPIQSAIDMENLIVFQTFESITPPSFPQLNYLFFGIYVVLFNYLLTAISTFQKFYFFISAAIISLLITLSGYNDLNVGGLSNSVPIFIMLIVSILPLYFFKFHIKKWSYSERWWSNLLLQIITLGLLFYLSAQDNPTLLMAENYLLPASIFSVTFLIYIGYVVVASLANFFFRLNENLQIKISWHISILFSLWFILNLLTLLIITGSIKLPIPLIPSFLLMVITGILGNFLIKQKIEQVGPDFPYPFVLQHLYWISFAITTWTWAKAALTGLQPIVNFLTHFYHYGQVAVGTVFFIYLMANFYTLINSGKALYLVLFKPQFFSFFHLRIGATMALVIMIVYYNGIVGTQLQAGMLHATADYYSQTGKNLEAGIFYESSWDQYRQNEKAKNALVHLLLDQNQPTLALQNLLESFDYAPSVSNILLLSKILNDQNKPLEALFYLEKGLEFFPGNSYFLNNKALIHSKLNQVNDAQNSLQLMNKFAEVKTANLIALQTQNNLFSTIETNGLKEDPFLLINQLANHNKFGNVMEKVVDLNTLPKNDILKAGILLNQWSNQPNNNYLHDINFLDSLIAVTISATPAQFLHEAKIIRQYQSGYLNTTLKSTNGTANVFNSSAGYYLFLSAQFYWKYLDFEKGGKDFLVAVDKGFQNIQPHHLALLYVGGYPIEALILHKKYGIEFPEYMDWGINGQLIMNEEMIFLDGIGKIHQNQISDLLPIFKGIQDSQLQAEFALNLLLYKGHWLSQKEIELLISYLTPLNISQINTKEWTELLINGNWANIPKDLKKSFKLHQDFDLTKNAYYGSLIKQALQNEKDAMKRYELIQEAIQFNSDPILILSYVKESKAIGLDQYGEEMMKALNNRFSISEIEQLESKYFYRNNP
jgi:hypothetical protein